MLSGWNIASIVSEEWGRSFPAVTVRRREDFKRIQRLWAKDRKKTANVVFNGTAPHNKRNIKELETFWKPQMEKASSTEVPLTLVSD